MADLSSIERRKLERLLRMGSGYVLDFSDRLLGGNVSAPESGGDQSGIGG